MKLSEINLSTKCPLCGHAICVHTNQRCAKEAKSNYGYDYYPCPCLLSQKDIVTILLKENDDEE